MMEKPYNNIAENYRRVSDEIAQAAVLAGRNPGEVEIMAVTKTVPPAVVNDAIAAGVRLLGENRAQELSAKYDEYNKQNVSIHFIGALQINKVRQIIDRVDMIQSLDRMALAKEINRRAQEQRRVMDVLIEVNIGGEDTKSGVLPSQALLFAQGLEVFHYLRLRGLMAIPPVCDKISEAETYFYRMRQLFVDIRDKNRDNSNVDILSMGMSSDYREAVKHGATLVRIGTALFGGRS